MKAFGLARLGRDAEIRRTPNGDAVCNLSLAFSYGQRDSEGHRPTQWVDASMWGKQAEALQPFMLKGSVHCFTLSDIHIETYQGQNGEGHKLVGRVDSVELGPRADNGGQQSRAPSPAPAPRQQSRAPAPPPSSSSGFEDLDSEIPF